MNALVLTAAITARGPRPALPSPPQPARLSPPARDQQPGPGPAGPAARPGGLACEDVCGQAGAFLDGELPAGDCQAVREHQENCGPCLREAALNEAARRLVRKHCGCTAAAAALQAKVLDRIRTITRAGIGFPPLPLQEPQPGPTARPRPARGWRPASRGPSSAS